MSTQEPPTLTRPPKRGEGTRKAKAKPDSQIPNSQAPTIPVSFGTAKLNDKTVGLPISISRSDLPDLNVAGEKLCHVILHGRILARPHGFRGDQETMCPDDNTVIDGKFRVGAFNVSERKITTTLSFTSDDVQLVNLRHFPNRAGLLTIETVEAIPAQTSVPKS